MTTVFFVLQNDSTKFAVYFSGSLSDSGLLRTADLTDLSNYSYSVQ